MKDEPKPIKPQGADEFKPMTPEQIDAAAEVTPERIEEAKRWVRSVDPDLADRLEGKSG